MGERIRSTPVDRKKENAVAFANWLNVFYVAVGDYVWVSRYQQGGSAKVRSSNELYEVFIQKTG